MKTLYVLRHGQAVQEDQASSDYDRVLTPRGQAEARQAAAHLGQRPRLPSLIVTSSASRARQTAELCLAALPPTTQLQALDDLYLAEPPRYLVALAAGADPHEAVLVVGHNPGLEALVSVLTKRSEHLATASLLEIELPLTSFRDLSGTASGLGRLVDTFRAR
jgi:phosphohistidine phosphatase